jgi:signal transduction histidine kinase/HAMP domain-containing protein
MRWWLALAFAAIAALTAVVVGRVFSERAAGALRARTQELAAGSSVAAAADVVAGSLRHGDLARAVADVATRRRLALFAFDRNGRLLAGHRSGESELSSIPFRGQALSRALEGRRFVRSVNGGRTVVVALPFFAGNAVALLVVAPRSALVRELGIGGNRIVEAAAWAVLGGAIAGMLVAFLIASRLRRIGRAAVEIERGNFDTRLSRGFPDELGQLVTRLDRMRARLRNSFSIVESERDRLRLLLERLQEGVIGIDRHLTVQVANAAARRLLLAPELGQGVPLPDPWPDPPLRRLASRLFRPGATAVEARVSPDGVRTYSVVGIPSAPQAQMAVLVFSDITQEEQRERAEREFVCNAAHELRTPIAAIAGAAEMLQTRAKEIPADRDRFLAIVDRQASRLGCLVRTLLVLARAQSHDRRLRLEPVELRPIFDEVASDLEPAAGVSVEVSCPSQLTVLGDRDLAGQVLANLASNAVKHTERGRIVLAARAGDDGYVSIEVSDTGRGIARAEQERVFDRFYSSDGESRDGFGLGLAIVREAVRALGGVVEIDSEPGRGTTARVRLAVAMAEAA